MMLSANKNWQQRRLRWHFNREKKVIFCVFINLNRWYRNNNSTVLFQTSWTDYFQKKKYQNINGMCNSQHSGAGSIKQKRNIKKQYTSIKQLKKKMTKHHTLLTLRLSSSTARVLYTIDTVHFILQRFALFFSPSRIKKIHSRGLLLRFVCGLRGQDVFADSCIARWSSIGWGRRALMLAPFLCSLLSSNWLGIVYVPGPGTLLWAALYLNVKGSVPRFPASENPLRFRWALGSLGEEIS